MFNLGIDLYTYIYKKNSTRLVCETAHTITRTHARTQARTYAHTRARTHSHTNNTHDDVFLLNDLSQVCVDLTIKLGTSLRYTLY